MKYISYFFCSYVSTRYIASYVVMCVEFYINVSPCPYFIGTENIHYGYYNNAKEFVLRAIHTLWNIKMPHYLGIWNILDLVYHVFLVCSTNHFHLISANRIQFPSTNLIKLESDHVLQIMWIIRKWNCVWVSVATTFIQY